jgi:hypothetical protein
MANRQAEEAVLVGGMVGPGVSKRSKSHRQLG